MKIRRIMLLLIFCTATQSMLLPTAAWAIPDKYEAELEKYAKLTEAVSGGFNCGSRVIIRVGNYTFYKFDRGSIGLAGLYVVAIYNNKVLLKASYNTYFTPGASEGLAQDIDKLPYGTFVVVAGMDEPTRLFDERGQKALYQIGAEKGLLGQEFRTSYLCLGVKGLSRGKAIEKVGMEELKHIGRKATEQINFTFSKKKEPGRISRKPGKHEGLMFGDTEVIYYIPKNFNPDTAQYLFGIHGAGAWHRPGALTRVDQFRDIADVENLVIIAPAFDCIFNRPVNRRKDFNADGKFKDPRIIKDRYLGDFIMLLNKFNEHRTDLKLIEIFDFFNQKLMKREKFYLDGHSGGGQFVARFVLFHPELIEEAAICSAGSFVFPNRDKDYPYGLKLYNLEKTFGPQIQANDLKLNNEQIDQKLAQMLDLKIFIIAGEKETEQENRPERDWQGKSTLTKARNFYKAMRDEDLRLKEKGVRPKSKPYQFELHTIPDVGHNSHETAKKAIELLFPIKKDFDKRFSNTSDQDRITKGKIEHNTDHFVPVDKGLSSQWIQELFARGGRKPYSSKELNTIGMPVGGIGSGQLYLCGDGTLGCWEIFNHHKSLGTGARNYKYRIPEKPVDQGFAVIVNSKNNSSIKRLNQDDFQEVEFLGEYPIGTVRYHQRGFPIAIELEAFSPFIPLNVTDSAFPATMFHITIENISTEKQKVAILGWLENTVCIYSAKVGLMASRCTDIINEKECTLIVHTTKEKMAPGSGKRKSVLLADFEQDDYGDWKVQGKAFGKGPAKGTLPNQQPVSGFLGKGLVNTYLNRDGPQGTLTSPVFTIDRRYLNFLIGGGGHEGKTCMNLLINGRVVYTATGANDEKLMWRSWDLRKYEGKEARIEIVDHASGGGWGHINVDHIELSDKRNRVIKLRDKLEDDGSMVLALAQRALPAAQAQRLMAKLSDSVGKIDFSEQSSYGLKDRKRTGIVSPEVELEPGSKHTFTFLLSWFFPNCQNGHYYASLFNDAVEVATYILDNEKRLSNETRLWHKTYYLDSTLPYWLLVRLHAPISTLATGTCQLWKNGRFWAYEGVVCCPGTCTHVWNYAQALARLFPRLERSVREMQDYGPAFTHQTGLVGYRGGTRGYAADGQCGTILKAYREHQMSADYRFLRKNWAKIKKSLEFLIKQDGNEDGLIENGQHNTFDRSFFGANTFVGSLYLAALRAGEEMAREMGDLPFAVRCQRIYQSGRNLSVERLWNGEYFIQDVELNLHPEFQYAEGCLSDQMFGQNWAHQLELGYLYPEKIVKASLKSVWKYNWTPDVATHTGVHEPERCFAGSCEPGLFNCTWPKSKHLEDKGVRYRNEVWTGVEYQVASGMIWEGMTEEGLSIVKGIHDRYHPLKRNPWNEVECGDHYARALASWGVFTALCGYQYHGPKGYLSFDPKIAMDDFRSAFTTAEGWGLFGQHRQLPMQENRIEVRSGKLSLRTLVLGIGTYVRTPDVSVQLSGRPIKASSTIQANQLVIRFREEIEIKHGEFLDILIKL